MTEHARLDLNIIGTTGLKQYGGTIYEEFLTRLQGKRGVATFREMRDNSSTIGAIAFVIDTLLSQAEWRVEPAGDTPEAREQAAFVDGCFEDMSHTFEELLLEILSMLTYGWAYFELVYKMRQGPDATDPSRRSKFDDGKIGWRKMPLRSQDTLDRWELDPQDNGVRGLWQFDPTAVKGSLFFIPIEKALLFRAAGAKSNPEGRSIYRNAVVDYHYLKRISQIEAVGIERDMTGLLTMEVPTEILMAEAGTTERQIRTELERMLAGLKRDEREFAMVPAELDADNKPTGYKLKLLATGGRRQLDTNETVMRYIRTILTSVLAEFLVLGANSVGSFALASSKTKLFSAALGAIMGSIASIFNRFAIPRLMHLNGVKPALYPQLVHGDIESPPLEEVAAYITALATAGMLTPNKPLERKLLEIGKLPVPAVDDDDTALPGETDDEQDEPEEDDAGAVA